jgi:hypothetical protein
MAVVMNIILFGEDFSSGYIRKKLDKTVSLKILNYIDCKTISKLSSKSHCHHYNRLFNSIIYLPKSGRKCSNLYKKKNLIEEILILEINRRKLISLIP